MKIPFRKIPGGVKKTITLQWLMGTSKKAGLPPGTPVYIGDEIVEKPIITLTTYTLENYEEKELETIDDALSFKDKPGTHWLNIEGVHRVEIIEAVCNHLGVHPLVTEDIVHTGQRPKVEDHEHFVYIVLRMLTRNNELKSLEDEQVSLILGPNYVVSFQEKLGDVFNPVRERIRSGKSRIRKSGADYLAYALLDTVVDNYFAVIEKMGLEIEELEDAVTTNPSEKNLHTIQKLKRENLYMRKSIWPLRGLINTMTRGEVSLMEESTAVYMKDVYDHTIQVMDTVETFRDMVAGMMDIYLSAVSNRMNEVMKVLTIIATIFIPLTFIAGVYGMNFKYMPELEYHYGYPAVVGFMILLGLLMLIFFKRRKWL